MQSWTNKSSTQRASSLGHFTGGTSASLSQENKNKILNPNLLFKIETIPKGQVVLLLKAAAILLAYLQQISTVQLRAVRTELLSPEQFLKPGAGMFGK